MNVTQHNLDKEKRLIELLGYNIIESDSSNRWIILDETEKQVGYIQYKKLYNKNKKNGHTKIFGYHTFVDSPRIIWDFKRNLNDSNGNILNDTNCNYSFEIKTDGQNNDHVEMDFGDYPSFALWNDEYGFIEFKINYYGLYINFKSKTENFDIEETLIYRNTDDTPEQYKEYIYQIKYCKKELALTNINSKGITVKEIHGIQHGDDKTQLTIYERTWFNRKLITNSKCIVKGTIEEMVTKHQMGIDCFSHFRFLINQIIPFHEEVISSLVSDDKLRQYNLSIFFQDNKKEALQTKVQKIRNKK